MPFDKELKKFGKKVEREVKRGGDQVAAAATRLDVREERSESREILETVERQQNEFNAAGKITEITDRIAARDKRLVRANNALLNTVINTNFRMVKQRLINMTELASKITNNVATIRRLRGLISNRPNNPEGNAIADCDIMLAEIKVAKERFNTDCGTFTILYNTALAEFVSTEVLIGQLQAAPIVYAFGQQQQNAVPMTSETASSSNNRGNSSAPAP